MKHGKQRFGKIMLGVLLICIVITVFLYANNDIGVVKSNLEADIRTSQKTMDDWTVDGNGI